MDTDAKATDRTGTALWTHPLIRALAVLVGVAAGLALFGTANAALPHRLASENRHSIRFFLFLALLLVPVVISRRRPATKASADDQPNPRGKTSESPAILFGAGGVFLAYAITALFAGWTSLAVVALLTGFAAAFAGTGVLALNKARTPGQPTVPTHAAVLLGRTMFMLATISIGAGVVLDKFDGMSGETATSHLKSELRNLMSAQDAFFMNFARYGAVEEVGDHWRYNPTIELQVLFLRADSTAFDVAATTQWTRSLTCGVWVGEPSQQTGRPEAPEREVHCWDTPNEDRNEYRTVGAARLGAR